MQIRENPAPQTPGPVKGLRALPSRWSPAHHRVLQYFLPSLRRHREERTRPPTGQQGHHPVRIGDRSRQHLGQGRRSRSGQRAQRAERRRHPHVRPVQQPGHHHSGGRVHDRHRHSGVMPGVAIASGSGEVPGVHRVLGHRHRSVAIGVGQREMQHPLHRQRGNDRRDRRVAAPRKRPDHRDLPHDQDGHQPPGHGAFGDRMVPEDRERGAEHGKQTGPRTRSLEAGPACSDTPVPGHVIRWPRRPSSLPAVHRTRSRRATPSSRAHDRAPSASASNSGVRVAR